MGRSILTAAVLLGALCWASGDAAAVGPGKELTWAGGGKGQVRFEGKEHAEEGAECKDCHPGIFKKKHGDAKMTMAALDSGRFCGACHNGSAAFSTKDPKECHECHKSGHEKEEKHKGRNGKRHDD